MSEQNFFQKNMLVIGAGVGLICSVGYLIYNSKKAEKLNYDTDDEDYDTAPYIADKEHGILQTSGGLIEPVLVKKEKITHDTYNFHFEYSKENKELGLHIGGHVIFVARFPTHDEPEGELVTRKYTPISKVHDKNIVVFPIKIYRKNQLPQFPHGGKMSQYLESLEVGDTIRMEGPKGKLEYLGQGNFKINKKFGKFHDIMVIVKKTKIGMTAGGTGITPCFQVIQSICLDDNNEKEYDFVDNKLK